MLASFRKSVRARGVYPCSLGRARSVTVGGSRHGCKNVARGSVTTKFVRMAVSLLRCRRGPKASSRYQDIMCGQRSSPLVLTSRCRKPIAHASAWLTPWYRWTGLGVRFTLACATAPADLGSRSTSNARHRIGGRTLAHEPPVGPLAIYPAGVVCSADAKEVSIPFSRYRSAPSRSRGRSTNCTCFF